MTSVRIVGPLQQEADHDEDEAVVLRMAHACVGTAGRQYRQRKAVHLAEERNDEGLRMHEMNPNRVPLAAC